MWSYGADYGEFGGMHHEAYVKDLPLERAQSDVLIAYELNGAPLPVEHGFPARLVIPVLWHKQRQMAYADDICENTGRPGPLPRAGKRPVSNVATEDSGGRTVPVWSVAPESIIVSPAPGEALKRDTPQEVWGWAWADLGIDRVDISVDADKTWMEARVEAREERAWQRFVLSWRPADPGAALLCSKAYSHDGAGQPEFGRRNAIHRVEVTVV